MSRTCSRNGRTHMSTRITSCKAATAKTDRAMIWMGEAIGSTLASAGKLDWRHGWRWPRSVAAVDGGQHFPPDPPPPSPQLAGSPTAQLADRTRPHPQPTSPGRQGQPSCRSYLRRLLPPPASPLNLNWKRVSMKGWGSEEKVEAVSDYARSASLSRPVFWWPVWDFGLKPNKRMGRPSEIPWRSRPRV
jgi:hypothetical protein